jgi:hypothetical protein
MNLIKAGCGWMLLALCGLAVFAQEGPPPAPGEIIRRHDRDGDSRISRDEAPERMARGFDRIDGNRDGFISLDELTAHEARLNGTGAPAPAYTNRVSITVEGDRRVIRSNGIADHPTGRFPNRGNPNAISPKDYTWRVPMKPQLGDGPTPTGINWFGVAINGVPFEPGTQEFYNEDRTSGWNYEAIGGTSNLGIDESLAHVQPNGAYHYHAVPRGLVAKLGGDTNRMLLVGWAADGFPIYTANGYIDPKNASSPIRKMKSSYRLKQGTRPGGPGLNYDGRFAEDFEFVQGVGDLDLSNGRFTVTPEFPGGIYCYFITDEFPRISRFWRGTADKSFFKHGPRPGRE